MAPRFKNPRASIDYDFDPPSSRSLAFFTESSPLLFEEEGGPMIVADTLPKIKLDFLSKMYGLITLQTLITTCICTLFVTYEPIRSFLMVFYPPVMIVSATAAITALLHLIQNIWVPWNNTLLMFMYTFWQSIVLGTTCVIYAETGFCYLIIESLTSTLIVLAGFTLYASLSHWDFSFSAAAAYILLVFIAMCSIVNGALDVSYKFTPFFSTAFIFFTSTLYSIFLLYDSKYFSRLVFFQNI